MVISMKNKLILFLITFIMGISSVNAYTTTNAKCVSDRSCMVVCNYTNKAKRNDGSIGNRYVTIYYDYKSNNFSVGYWSGLAGDGKVLN